MRWFHIFDLYENHMTSKLSSIALAISSVLIINPSFAEDDTSEIEVITIKGDFRETNIQQSPNAVSLLSEQDIKRRNAQNLEEIIALAPNVNYAGGSQRARYYQIRGIGERSQFQEPINPSVGIIIDDVDFTGIGSISSMFDVAQAEVFRGPQGTRFGANALAGIVNITTNAPTDSFEGAVKATVGNYDSQGLGLVVSGPASEKVNYRFVAEQYKSDGFIENVYLNRDDTNNRDELSVRGKLAIEASKELTIDISVMHFDFDNGYDAFSLDNNRNTYSDEPGFDTQETTALSSRFNYTGFNAFNMLLITSFSDSDIGYGFDEDWAYGKYDDNTGECISLDTGCLGEVWGYSTKDHYDRNKKTATLEYRLTSNQSSRIFNNSTDWVVGVYINKQDETLNRAFFDWDLYSDAEFNSTFETTSSSLYGQLDTRLTDKLTLTSGLRFEHRAADYINSYEVKTAPKEDMLGGKLALTYQMSETDMVYVAVNKGYKAGGINTQGSIDESLRKFDKESLWNYEAGYKASLLNGDAYIRASAFYMDRKNIQLKNYVVSGQSFNPFLQNASKGKNYGLELESSWQINDDVELYSSLGLLKTQFDSFINGKGEEVGGDEQAHAPDYQFALGINYYLNEQWLLNVAIDGKDDYKFSDSHEQRSDAYQLLHASITYSEEQWDISLWGRNITDEDYHIRGFYFGNDPRDGYVDKTYYQLGEPAVFGATFNYSF